MSASALSTILTAQQGAILAEWQGELEAAFDQNQGRIGRQEMEQQCREFMHHLELASRTGGKFRTSAPEWASMVDLLTSVSKSRVSQGFSSSETANFIFSFKKPLLDAVRQNLQADANQMVAVLWEATELIDSLGLFTIESYQQSRENVIARQQDELLELSTPVVKLWEGILALPMIGTLDSTRTQIVMESLLQRIVETGADYAIIDITGVPTVDTLVAQHLLKTVTAIRLMGAEAIISGIRPQIAQTIVHLGVDLGAVTTKATLADALSMALKQTGYSFVKADKK